jgi:hypothetical protein
MKQLTLKFKDMATFKIHLFKKLPNGKINSYLTECGRKPFTPNGAPNVMLKTNAFKDVFLQDEEQCCAVCIKRAKEQGRL